MEFFVQLALGALAGALAIRLNRPRRGGSRPGLGRGELRRWALFLVAAALVYVVFAIWNGAPEGWLGIELIGLAVYGSLALVGCLRWPLLVGAGWLAHGMWDLCLHPFGSPGFVPNWYPAVCLGFDVWVGLALVRLAWASRTG